jgi:N-acyl-D-aspartate/D-glutamate deacylase
VTGKDRAAVHDIVIRGGTIVDGTGAPRYTGDVAIDGGALTQVGGRVDGKGRRELVGDGLVVAPGWVDIHTHYDGQVTWDPALTPSGWHGVTTVVMGNCGVGFAPVRPGDEAFLIELMEGVEDIRLRAPRGHRLAVGELRRVPRRARPHRPRARRRRAGAARSRARVRDA